MYNKIKLLAQQYHQETIQTRRDFHKYAERGWLEMRTASLVARRLDSLGYQVSVGKEVMREEFRMGLPSKRLLQSCPPSRSRPLLHRKSKEWFYRGRWSNAQRNWTCCSNSF